MREQFEEQLRLLNEYLIEMGKLCEESIAKVTEAFKDNEGVYAEIHALETAIDAKEKEIEALCLKLILQQQPVASDLRLISSALKMISDMERIGDQCCDITDIIRCLERHEELEFESTTDIEEMAKAVTVMLSQAVEAFVNRDLSAAAEVMRADDTVDRLFDKVKEELIAMIANYPTRGEACLDMLMIAKYFERIGDHTTNLAEWVEFSVTGKHPSGK